MSQFSYETGNKDCEISTNILRNSVFETLLDGAYGNTIEKTKKRLNELKNELNQTCLSQETSDIIVLIEEGINSLELHGDTKHIDWSKIKSIEERIQQEIAKFTKSPFKIPAKDLNDDFMRDVVEEIGLENISYVVLPDGKIENLVVYIPQSHFDYPYKYYQQAEKVFKNYGYGKKFEKLYFNFHNDIASILENLNISKYYLEGVYYNDVLVSDLSIYFAMCHKYKNLLSNSKTQGIELDKSFSSIGIIQDIDMWKDSRLGLGNVLIADRINDDIKFNSSEISALFLGNAHEVDSQLPISALLAANGNGVIVLNFPNEHNSDYLLDYGFIRTIALIVDMLQNIDKKTPDNILKKLKKIDSFIQIVNKHGFSDDFIRDLIINFIKVKNKD